EPSPKVTVTDFAPAPSRPPWRPDWLAAPRRLARILPLVLPLLALCAAYRGLIIVSERNLEETLAEVERIDPGWRIADVEARRKIIAPEENAATRVMTLKPLIPGDWPNQTLMDKLQERAEAPERQLGPEIARLLKEDLSKVPKALPGARLLKDMP